MNKLLTFVIAVLIFFCGVKLGVEYGNGNPRPDESISFSYSDIVFTDAGSASYGFTGKGARKFTSGKSTVILYSFMRNTYCETITSHCEVRSTFDFDKTATGNYAKGTLCIVRLGDDSPSFCFNENMPKDLQAIYEQEMASWGEGDLSYSHEYTLEQLYLKQMNKQ